MKWFMKFLFGWLNPRITLPANTTPAMPDPKPVAPVTVDPVISPNPQPVIITDDLECNLLIKCGGREVHNIGQVTYIKRFLTCKPYDGSNCVCIQYDVTGVVDGERVALPKDESRKGVAYVQLPTDVPIGKVVCWYN
jgi:hypothetical protein